MESIPLWSFLQPGLDEVLGHPGQADNVVSLQGECLYISGHHSGMKESPAFGTIQEDTMLSLSTVTNSALAPN